MAKNPRQDESVVAIDLAVNASGSTRSRILEAAIGLVGEVGAAHLSLDAVAGRAGVSKGGLLYNFPTKVALLKALVAAHILEQDIRRVEAEADLGGPNRSARAFTTAACACEGKPPAGFLAAIAENPDLLEPVKARNGVIVDRLRADEDPVLGLIAFLAVEGMKHLDLFECNPLTTEERRAVTERLQSMLATSPSETPT